MASTRHRLDFVNLELQRIRKDGLYRRLRYVRSRGAHIMVDDKRLINLCSNDYLGMSPSVLASAEHWHLQSSSRLVSGNDESYKELEEELARHKAQQNSLVYPTGYMANLGVIPVVTTGRDLVVSDEFNHASIVEACRLSDAKIVVYRHNDMKDLQEKLGQNDASRRFIVTEGVFSMDGDLAPLGQITEIAEKFEAVTVVDDAHGDFVMGRDGRGTPNYFNVAEKIDLYVSSLSKGLGAFGGYVASQNDVIDLCINRSKPFVYTSALPSFLVEIALRRVMDASRAGRKERLERNTRMLARGLEGIGYIIDSKTHIIPIMVGDETDAMRLGDFLFENGLFVQPIRYPTVRRGMARLRISVTAWLSDEDIQRTLQVFEMAHNKKMC